MNGKIAFIGAGNMAGAFAGGLVSSGMAPSLVSLSAPHMEKLDALRARLGVSVTTSNADNVRDADTVVLAVKPQVMEKCLTELMSEIGSMEGKLVISVAAGITVERLSELLGGHRRIVRFMPNTPALIGRGMTGMFAAPGLGDDDLRTAEKIASAAGKWVWVKTEDEINTVTALSGSSPAYFFMIMEAMVEYGVSRGMDGKSARDIVEGGAIGSILLAEKSPEKTLAELREAVTSKGGTTFAALEAFRKGNCRGMHPWEDGMAERHAFFVTESVRSLTDIISLRIVVADEEHVPAADGGAAADLPRAAPHHLGIVPDNLPVEASVHVVVVVLLLVYPVLHAVSGRVVALGAHEEVLAESLPPGVLERAGRGELLRVALRDSGDSRVP